MRLLMTGNTTSCRTIIAWDLYMRLKKKEKFTVEAKNFFHLVRHKKTIKRQKSFFRFLCLNLFSWLKLALSYWVNRSKSFANTKYYVIFVWWTNNEKLSDRIFQSAQKVKAEVMLNKTCNENVMNEHLSSLCSKCAFFGYMKCVGV